VSHDRYMLDRVSTMVIGLDSGPDGVQAGIFADYSQWEALRSEPAAEKAAVKESRPATLPDEPKRKLSYLQQREWDGMESKILEAEQELARFQQELEAFASDPERVGQAYEKMQAAQGRVDELYARWAELEASVAK